MKLRRVVRIFAGLLGCCVTLLACADLQLTPEGAAPNPPPTRPDAGDAGDAAVNVTTTQCMQDALSGTVLCKQLSLCPSAAVDPQLFGPCGYVNRGGLYTLECICNAEFMCSMGPISSCEQAFALLKQTNYQQVCSQIGSAACTTSRRSGSVTPPGGKSGCDRECARTCSGSKSCLELCGC
jgi:hypothetical protein